MIAHFAQGAKGVMAGGANAHGCVGLHHHSGAAELTGAVDNVSHEVQAGLQEQSVITSKQGLVYQLFHLQNKKGFIGWTGKMDSF